jgi:hypothetical protein
METAQTQRQAPDYKTLIFQLNPENGYYERIESPPGFEKVPFELKIEPTHNTQQIKSDILIRSRVKNGKYQFFTGLLKTNFDSWFFGDHFQIVEGKKKNSFILFHFSSGNMRFSLYYFNSYKLYPGKRGHFIRDFIYRLKQ